MSNGEARFRVSISDAQQELIRQWHRLGVERGISPSIGQTLARAQELMKYRPLRWGDQYSTSTALGLRLYRGYVDGIYVFYAVDLVRHIVLVSRVRLASWHPLYREGE